MTQRPLQFLTPGANSYAGSRDINLTPGRAPL